MTRPTLPACLRGVAAFCSLASLLFAETGHDAWLRYAPVEPTFARNYANLPAVVVSSGNSPIAASAKAELLQGIHGMLGRRLRLASTLPAEPSILLETSAELAKLLPGLPKPAPLKPESYSIYTHQAGGHLHWIIAGGDERGVLYGVSAFLRRIGTRQPIQGWTESQSPYAPIRWLNHWDNLEGTIERGYGGPSIFFENGNVRADLTAAGEYARLLSSLGINGCVINNVNANPKVITPEFLPQLARVAEAFRPWGVQIAISVDFSSPKRAGGLETFDPLDPAVAAWWKSKIDEIYRAVPDLGGVVVKADSEGRLGPSAYNRTHADAANVIARALKPHNGVIFYRGFVYNHRMDWRDLKNDRARAAYDNFVNLDGKFDDNVIIQIKHGPIDFQVREPASPLFAALEKTNQAIELQITQEYFMQGRYMVYLAPMWKEALDFDLHAKGAGTPVKALASGRTFKRPTGGFVGVSNAGLDANWMRHHMSQANLYAFGRLAWNPDLTPAQIIDEWTRLTFSSDPAVLGVVNTIQLDSWRDFENHTGPLGTQTLTDISGNHYGPVVESSERNGWGQWHRADEKGIGMNRTVATGTGYIGQYKPPVAKLYETLDAVPDELILWMHHVPYTHKLRQSGKTVIQYIYDSHYDGASAVAGYARKWRTLKGRIDEARYNTIERDLIYQAGHARVWRDAVNSWFLKTSGIPDERGRAGNFPDRYEAESLQLERYKPLDVKPWEGASGAKAISCDPPAGSCRATLSYQGRAGWFTIATQYFDQNDGVSSFILSLNGQPVDHWKADDRFPTRGVNSHSSTWRLTTGVALRPGDTIQIEGSSGGREHAALDYVEILPLDPFAPPGR